MTELSSNRAPHGASDPAPNDDGAPGERLGEDSLRFVRSFRVPVGRVWNALTTAEGLAMWLGRPVHLELVAGGAFEIDLNDDTRMDGRVVELEPNRRLVIAWHETSDGASTPYGTLPGDESQITFDLSANEAGGTTLIFTHRYIRGGDIMASFGAGWHAIFDALRASLTGSSQIDREARYVTLKPMYDERIGDAG